MNGHYLFLSHGLFLGTSVFLLPLILLRLSLSLLQEVCYLLLLDFCPYHPSFGICRALFSWQTSATSFTKLKFPPGLSNVYTRRCDARGPGRTTVLVLVSSLCWSADWLQPIQGRIVHYLHQDLNWHYKRSEVGELRLPIRKFLLFPCGLPNTSCLLLFIMTAAWSFVSLPFSFHFFCKHRVFYVHVLLRFSE